jgi:hypothetical protein
MHQCCQFFQRLFSTLYSAISIYKRGQRYIRSYQAHPSHSFLPPKLLLNLFSFLFSNLLIFLCSSSFSLSLFFVVVAHDERTKCIDEAAGRKTVGGRWYRGGGVVSRQDAGAIY